MSIEEPQYSGVEESEEEDEEPQLSIQTMDTTMEPVNSITTP